MSQWKLNFCIFIKQKVKFLILVLDSLSSRFGSGSGSGLGSGSWLGSGSGSWLIFILAQFYLSGFTAVKTHSTPDFLLYD